MMQRIMFVILATAVVASMVISGAALAQGGGPITDDEFIVSDVGHWRQDIWNWKTGTERQDDFAHLGTFSGMAWANGWKLNGVDDGIADMYVPATQNDNFYVVDSSGAALNDTIFGTPPQSNSLIQDGIHNGSDTSVRGDYVYVLNSDGATGTNAYITRYGRYTGWRDTTFAGDGKMEIASVTAKNIAVTADGSIYVAGTGADGVQKYNSAGALVGTVAAGIGDTFGVREDWTGNLWVTRYSGDFGAFGKIDLASGAYSELYNSADAEVSEFSGFGFTTDGTVLVVSTKYSYIYSFSTAGESYGGFQILDYPFGDPVRYGPNILTTWNRDGSFAPPVPEPGSILALGSGLVGLLGFAVRRRK